MKRGRIVDAFLRPRSAERDEAIARARQRLSPELFVQLQGLGRQNAGCAATFNVMEGCDLACRACYAASPGNVARALPREAVFEQLELLRAEIGPWANVQLTGGEVTLLPVDELVAILRHASSLELDLMLMTNGERLRRDPALLARLVREGGLAKLAFHVDTTQRGRDLEMPVRRERDLDPVRAELVELIRSVRAVTGCPLQGAHTLTVTDENVEDVPEVVRWVVDHDDVVSILSLQPAAKVGSTGDRDVASTTTRQVLWQRIGEGLGFRPNARAFLFGHPDCSAIALLAVVRFGSRREIVEIHRAGHDRDRRLMSRLLNGSLAGFSHDAEPPAVATARALGLLARDPKLAFELLGLGLLRALEERRWLPAFVAAAASGERVSIRPLTIVVHSFMSAEESASSVGRQRRAACAFRVVAGERLVPMCEVNAKRSAFALERNDSSTDEGQRRRDGTPRKAASKKNASGISGRAQRAGE